MYQYKLGVGPMSREIIEIIDRFADKVPLMVVASRNQVDYNAGYVCTTEELPALFKNRASLLVCRDHCGPYFRDTDKGLSLDDAIEECKKTIDADIAAGFDLIHVDVSRIKENQLHYAKLLMDYILGKSPNIKLEFGSEDNTGEDLSTSEARIDEQLEFVKQYLPNIEYFVSQTGSLTKHEQVGKFDIEINSKLAKKIHRYGIKFKEHNADYLAEGSLGLRKLAGVDAVNIAPQLGAIQTHVSKWASQISVNGVLKSSNEWVAFEDMVYNNNMWQRWVPAGVSDKEIAVRVSGHYFFNTPEYQAVLKVIRKDLFNQCLVASIERVFKLYTKE